MPRVEIVLTDEDLARVDSVRGLVQRATWIKDLIARELSRLEAEKPRRPKKEGK